MKAPTLSRDTLPERVARQLEVMILDGRLAQGERLPAERTLCDKLGVSRNSLREALKDLRGRGVLEVKRGSGTRVAFFQDLTPSTPLQGLLQNHPQTLKSLLEVRRTLEGEAAYYAAQRADPADLRILKAAYEAVVAEHPTANQPEDHAARDIAFHRAIYTAAHNAVLLLALNGIRDLMMGFMFGTSDKLYPLPQTRRALKTQHRRIYRAIAAKQPAAARRAATAHIDAVANSLQQLDH